MDDFSKPPGPDWPHNDKSQLVASKGLRWHIQRFEEASGTHDAPPPKLLLLHGTGASTHSWRDLIDTLRPTFDILTMDLPGHGFTATPRARGLSLPGMTGHLADLLTTLNYEPDLIVGHSAGAAIALRLVLDGHAHPKTIVSLNGALRPFPGMAGHIFPTIARALFLNPLTPAFMAWSGSKRANVEKLLNDTGSKLTSEGIDYYARLFRSSAHVAGALGMMAHWDLQPLVDDLPKLKVPLVLFAGMKDKTIDPSVADDVAARVMSTQVVRLQCLGHLAHEEQPDLIASKIYDLHKKTKSDHTTLINS